MGRWVLVSAASFLLLSPAALRADTLQLSDRATIQGDIQELILRVEGLPRAYPRADIRAVALAPSGPDAVELASGDRLEGQVMSLTVRRHDRLYAYGRSRLRSVELDESPAAPDTSQEAPLALPAAEPAPRARELTPEELASQKKGLAKSQDFCQQFLAKAGRRGLFASPAKAEERKKRILAMAELIRQELLAGRLFTDGQLHQRYEAALAARPFAEPTRTLLRTMAQGVKVIEGNNKETPELVVEPFPERKY